MTRSLFEIGGRPIDAGNARHRWQVRRGWRLELDGGVGEASPLLGRSRESHEEVGEALARFCAGESVALPPSARFAVETAELDARARRENTSVAALLGAELGPPVRASELGTAPSAACRCVKIKAGPWAAWPNQRRAIEALLERRPLRIRIDFNGSLTIEQAEAIAGYIAEAGWPIDFIEDPAPMDQLRPLAVPIAIDAGLEDAGGLAEALALGRRRVASVAVLKPALVGGLRAVCEIAESARAAGMAAIVSHLLDGPIALAACAELACAIGGELAHGVGPHPGLASYLKRPIDQISGAHLIPRRGGIC